MNSHGTKRDPSRTLTPSSPICSRKMSELSARPSVTPQATWPLWPTGKAGSPANEAPAKPHVGVRTWARYQCGGRVGTRWGSLARIGRLLAVFEGPTAQLLDARFTPTTSARAARSRARASAAGPAVMPSTALTGCHSGYGGSRRVSASGPSNSSIRCRTNSTSQLAESAMDWRR